MLNRLFILVGVIVFTYTAATSGGQNPIDPCSGPDGPACGKARALAAGWAESMTGLRGGPPAEALTDTDVLHYDLDIEITNISPGTNTCTITGSNAITVRSLSASLSTFTFRLRSQYAVTSATITDLSSMTTTPVVVNGVSTTTRVATLDRTYGVGEEFVLTIAYTGTSASRGFGSIEVGTQGGTPVVATLSEAYFAYTWWPAKDGDFGEPGDNSDKAFADLTVTVPNNYVVPSNGVLVSQEPLGGGRWRYHWATAYPISTYLICFGATNYNKWTQTYVYPGGSMPVEFYIYPGNDSGANRAAWEQVLDMLATYRTVFGEYPFVDEKYGHYNFNFGGGMEHQTMTGLGTFSESVIAHELGHQWFGDMITCKTWSDIWLNEGFATYSEALWEERKNGFDPTAYLNAMTARKPVSFANSVWVPPAETADMNRIFAFSSTYQKGAWVLHMLRHLVGDATFFQLLADYRAAFEFDAATTDDFANVASAAAGEDLSWFFDQWVFQIGAPAYSYGGTTTNVNGQDYFLVRVAQTHTTPGYPSVFTMPIDFVLTIGGNQQTVTVLNDARTEWFVVPTSGPMTSHLFDPWQWVLRTSAGFAAYQPGPPTVVETDPPPGASVDQSANLNQLTVWFHTPVNAAVGDFSLVGAATGAQPLSLVSGGAGANPIVLGLTGPLAPDTYTLTIAGTVTAADSGMMLDGEVADAASAASLPSGDGEPGGSGAVEFVVVPCQVAGDIDQDCDADAADVDLFSQVLVGLDTDPVHVAGSDLDSSGTPDGRDIAPFIEAHLSP